MATSTSAGAMGVEQLGGHRRPGGRLGRRRVRRQVLGEDPTLGRSVGVEVLQHHEAGAGGDRAGEHAVLQRRELLRPAVVGRRVEAGVHDSGALAHGRGERRVAGITGDAHRAGNGPAGAADGDHLVAAAHQGIDEVPADLTDPEHDVAVHRVPLRPSASGRAAVSTRDGDRPARAEHGVVPLDVHADRRRDRPAEGPQRGRGRTARPVRYADPGGPAPRPGRSRRPRRRSRPGRRVRPSTSRTRSTRRRCRGRRRGRPRSRRASGAARRRVGAAPIPGRRRGTHR